jgi:hypothetical protein
MIVFAFLMIAASVSMIHANQKNQRSKEINFLILALIGLLLV